MVPRFSKQNNRSINACSRYAATDSTATGLAVSGLAATGVVVASTVTFAIVAISSSAFATSTSGNVQLDTEVATSIAMKIQSPNDANPDCMVQSGVTYGEANRYATSNGAEGSKQVDTFDGAVGGADELNSNTSCATLTMNPNAFDSTYSDVTVYTNSATGYSLTVQSAEGTSPNLVNIADSTQYIPAGILTESNGNTPGGQNKWAIKSDNGLLDTWTAMSTTDTTVRSYDQETSGGSTTRVTYGISTGNNPTGKYATTLTYTATMFDGENTSIPSADISAGTDTYKVDGVIGGTIKVPYNETRAISISPAPGHYLTNITCVSPYTCTDSNGDPLVIPENNTNPVTVHITNSSKTEAGTVTISTTAIEYPVTVSGDPDNDASSLNTSTSNLSIPYGSSATLTLTPSAGYYLSSYTCPEGYTCTKSDDTTIETGTTATSAQTIKITNNNTTTGGSMSFTGAISEYEVAITPSLNATTSTNLLSIPYGGSTTFTITPATGYYLTSVTCSSGYTCSGYSTGTAANPNATSRGAQTITVKNNSHVGTGAVSFALSNLYTVSISNSATSANVSSVNVSYGGSATVHVTPSSGYYLSSVSCSPGYTCSGYNTGASYTSRQTITIANSGTASTGTVSFIGSALTAADKCPTVSTGSTYSVDGITYVKLADGGCYIQKPLSRSGYCPANSHVPTVEEFTALIASYGGYYNSNIGGYYTYRATQLLRLTTWQQGKLNYYPTDTARQVFILTSGEEAYIEHDYPYSYDGKICKTD